MIVVLDSGIWISAFQFGGIPQAALDSVFRDHTIAICDQIVWEVRATLVGKFSWTHAEVLAIMGAYTGDGMQVEVTECAVNSNAAIIVSGDNDILKVSTYNGIQALTARQFLDRF